MPWSSEKIHSIEKWWNKKEKSLSQPHPYFENHKEEKRAETVRIHKPSGCRADQEIVTIRVRPFCGHMIKNDLQAGIGLISEVSTVLFLMRRV